MSSINDEARRKIIEKVSKMMQKTVENGCTEAEANAAAEMVGKLLRENNLAMEDISVASIKTEIVEEMSTHEFERMLEWERILYSNMCGACSCHHIYTHPQYISKTGKIRNAIKVKIVGTEGDAKMCRYFCDVLIVVLPPLAKEYCDRMTYRNRTERLEMSRSYLTGMCVTLRDRLKAMIRPHDAAPAETNRGLILVNNKEAAIKLYKEEKYPDLKNLNFHFHNVSADHFANGKEKGKEVRLNFGLPSENTEKVKIGF